MSTNRRLFNGREVKLQNSTQQSEDTQNAA